MKNRFLVSMLVCLIALSLSACGKKDEAPATSTESDNSATDSTKEAPAEEEIAKSEGKYSDGVKWGLNYEGSAVYLDGKTVVVTITVDNETTPFGNGEVDKMKERTKSALDFISSEVENYGKKAEFVFGESDTEYSYKYSAKDIDDFIDKDYKGVIDELCASTIDSEALREKYSADGVAYLFYIPGEQYPFAAPHLTNDETLNFYEACYISFKSVDGDGEMVETGVPVFAYNILQLFGAVELYSPSAEYGLSNALCSVVEDKYSEDIMYFPYNEDNSMNLDNAVGKITDITAYAVGLKDSFDELKDYPEFAKDYPACLTNNYSKNTNNGVDASKFMGGDEEEEIDLGELSDEEIDELFGGEIEVVDADDEDGASVDTSGDKNAAVTGNPSVDISSESGDDEWYEEPDSYEELDGEEMVTEVGGDAPDEDEDSGYTKKFMK